MSLVKVSYKGLKAICPNASDVALASQNVIQGQAYLKQLESLGFYAGNDVYDATVVELEYSVEYRDLCISALSTNKGGRV